MAQSWKDMEAEVLKKLDSDDHKTYEWVKKTVNLDADNDVRQKTRDELLKMFPGTVVIGGLKYQSLNDMACLSTLIWQSWLMIQTGNLDPVLENIRSFGYRELEPFLIDHDLMLSDTGGPIQLFSPVPEEYETLDPEYDQVYDLPETSMMAIIHRRIDAEDRGSKPETLRAHRDIYLQNGISRCFGKMVLRGIFTFKGGFGFADPREDFRIIGHERPHLVFVTEKEGLFWLCQYANQKHGISALASNGESGLLCDEYTVDALKKAAQGKPDRVTSVKVGSLTDYDPWGHKIADNIFKKLSAPIFFGKKVTLEKLNGNRADMPKFYDDAELVRKRRDLRIYYVQSSKGAEIDAWGKLTGGVSLPGDEPDHYYGIHIDGSTKERLEKAVDDWVKSHSHD